MNHVRTLKLNKCTGLVTVLLTFVMVFALWGIIYGEPVHAISKVCKVTASTLTVRSGAATSYKKITTLKKGTYKIIKSSKRDKKGASWYKVEASGKNGYIHSKYTKLVKFSITAVNQEAAQVKTSGDALTLRAGPGTIFGKVGTIPNKTSIKINGKCKDITGVYWYRFKYKNKEYFASSKYIKMVKSSESLDPSTGPSEGGDTKQEQILGIVNTAESALNVRKGPGSTEILGKLDKGEVVTILGTEKSSSGESWYKIKYSESEYGYVAASYITIIDSSDNDDFESYMKSQGFPESYKAGLRKLHAAHPKWTFKGYKTKTTWSKALDAQTKNVGTNLVSPQLPAKYRSKASGAYNSKTGTYTKFDGRWYAADKTVVAYYLDPRNFINESGIYQFMTHQYHSASQNTSTVKAVIKGSFMQTRKTASSTYPTYAELINAAGKAAKVNPNVIASMIVQEQGINGTSGLISGSYSGYKGYYNFFNIGAYTTSSMTAVQRGLWYAKQSGSYGRPWNSVYKSIKGGALFYGENYVKKNQDTYYYKKFNVKNGVSNIGKHQYMTNVSAAASEGKHLSAAFKNNSTYAAIIEIPIYESMPKSACKLP